MLKRRFVCQFIAIIIALCITIISSPVTAIGEFVVETNLDPNISISELPNNIVTLIDNPYAQSVQKTDSKYTLTVDNGDGTATTTVFSTPIKYSASNGELEFIDTSFAAASITARAIDGYDYRNKANSFSVEYSKNINKGIRFISDGSQLVMKPFALSSKSLTGYLDETDAEQPAFVYPKAFGTNTEVRYYNTNTGTKEEIILNSKTNNNKFDFELQTFGNTVLIDSETNRVAVFNPLGKEVFRFGALFAYDAAYGTETGSSSDFQHINYDLEYQLVSLGDSRYKLSVIVPSEWLNDPETVYPVTIDPSVSATSSTSNIADTYVRESAPNTNYHTATYMRIGNYNGTNYTSGRCYSYIRFIELPEIINATVTSATLKLTLRTGQSTAQPVAAWRVTQSWNCNTVTWNTRPANGESTDHAHPHENLSHYNIEVGTIVNRWYKDSSAPNYGFLVNYADENYPDLNSIYSSDCGTASRLPSLSITYQYNVSIPFSDGRYFVKNRYSGYYLDSMNQYNESGIQIKQYQFDGTVTQQWRFCRLDNGYYVIRSGADERLVLGVESNYLSNGSYAVLSLTTPYEITSSIPDYCQWMPIRVIGTNYYRLASKCSFDSKVLTVKDASIDNSANIIQYQYNASYNDEWLLEACVDKLSSYTTFSAFDLSDNNTYYEENIVATELLALGYKNVGAISNLDNHISARQIKEIGRYSDIVYINGHGYSPTVLKVQQIYSNESDEYLAADATVLHNGQTVNDGIGAILNGNNVTSSSFWNKKTKWLILGECNQLNYFSDGAGNTWNDLYGAQIWARTMLGTEHRMHGILGYYGSAIGPQQHCQALERFFEYSNAGESMIEAWEHAHLSGNIFSDFVSNGWAAIYHLANQNDTLTEFTPTTSSSSACNIYRISHGNASSPAPLPVQNASAVSQSSTFNSVLTDVSFTPITFNFEQRNRISTQLIKSLGDIVLFESDGSIRYTSSNFDYGNINAECSFSSTEAVSRAETQLLSLGLLPNHQYSTTVSKIVRERVEVSSENTDVPAAETIKWVVRFIPQYNGIDILSDTGNSITVTLTNSGIDSLFYKWSDISVLSTTVLSNSISVNNKIVSDYTASFESTSELEIKPVYIVKNGAVTFGTSVSHGAYFNARFYDSSTGKEINF